MARLHRTLAAAALLATIAPAAAHAQFVSPYGFAVRARVDIRKPPADVYQALLRIGQWWSPEHTYSGDASNLTLEARPGGCFCERLKDGGGVEHMRVIHAAPGALLRMSGALGPLQPLGVTGTMTLALSSSLGGTSVDLTYSAGGFSETGFNQLAPAVGSVLTEQLNRLKSYVETGTAR